MAENYVYRVRVLFLDGKEKNFEDLNWVQSKRKFLFFVTACLEFDNDFGVRCINIFRNKTCVRYYQNYPNRQERRIIIPKS